MSLLVEASTAAGTQWLHHVAGTQWLHHVAGTQWLPHVAGTVVTPCSRYSGYTM